MVRDILDTSKVQDLQEEEKQKLYAGGEIGAVLQEYAMQIADKKLEVTDSIPEDCMLFMSRNTFQKVWSNLIGNAVQYTEQGGQITIAADTDKIWIENSCTPLTEEQLAYIYEPFYRVDDTRAVPWTVFHRADRFPSGFLFRRDRRMAGFSCHGAFGLLNEFDFFPEMDKNTRGSQGINFFKK